MTADAAAEVLEEIKRNAVEAVEGLLDVSDNPPSHSQPPPLSAFPDGGSASVLSSHIKGSPNANKKQLVCQKLHHLEVTSKDMPTSEQPRPHKTGLPEKPHLPQQGSYLEQ